jgi:hypothetical protein
MKLKQDNENALLSRVIGTGKALTKWYVIGLIIEDMTFTLSFSLSSYIPTAAVIELTFCRGRLVAEGATPGWAPWCAQSTVNG